MSGTYNSGEALTVSTSAVGFTASTYGTARQALVQVQDQDIRYRFDGNDPTASVGFEAAVGAIITLTSKDQLIKFRAIRSGGTDGKAFALFGY